MRLLKKYIPEILCIIFLCFLFSFNANAESSKWAYDESGKVLYLYKIENHEITITRGGNLYDLIIPEEVEGYPVTKIGNMAFCYNWYFTSITLPETLITIEDDAMYNCENIKEIIIPKSVQNIGIRALGYKLKDHDGDFFDNAEKMDDFIIKGYKGTAAETYAKENDIEFIALDDEQPEVTTTATTQISTTTSTTVSTSLTTTSTQSSTSTSATTATSATTSSATSTSITTSTTNSSQTTPIISTTATTSTTSTDITVNIVGDANNDGKLNIVDAAFIAQRVAQRKTDLLPSCADYNMDGFCDIRDAAAIARDVARRKI